MKGQVSDIHLNALVDGELSPAEAAWVTETVAADPDLARRVVRLRKMKAALADFGGDLPLPDMPQPPVPKPSLPRRPSWRQLALAASVAAAGLLALVAWPSSVPQRSGDAPPRLAQHDQWLAATGETLALDLPRGFEWMSEVTGASGLQLVHRHRHDEAEHLGFKGPNACRLSLFVAQVDMPDEPLRLMLSESVQHAQWQMRGFAFEMIARDMAPARFATVATGLHRGSHELDDSSGLHVALLESARLPCLI